MSANPVRHSARTFALLKKVVRERYQRCCAYCGLSEQFGGGANAFGIDNFIPKSSRPDLAYDFDNAVYACHHCNTFKGNFNPPPELHPGRTQYADQLSMERSGILIPKTRTGELLIQVFDLNAEHLVSGRRHFVEIDLLIRNLPLKIVEGGVDHHRRIFEELIAYRNHWGKPIWGDFLDASKVDFQIIPPEELGDELNERLMSLLHSDPTRIRELNGTLFEEVIAEILAHRGFEVVKHVGRRGDTGADIFALEKSPVTGVKLRYFVETKLWTGKIGVEVVDRVSGAIVNERHKWGWHLGLIIAPSGWKNMLKFTREELQLLGIELRDNKDVEDWLKSYRPAQSGLWLPLRDDGKILPTLKVRH